MLTCAPFDCDSILNCLVHDLVPDNYCHDNGDAGLAMMESFNAQVRNNVFENNKYGIRMSVGCADNVFVNNDIIDSTK